MRLNDPRELLVKTFQPPKLSAVTLARGSSIFSNLEDGQKRGDSLALRCSIQDQQLDNLEDICRQQCQQHVYFRNYKQDSPPKLPGDVRSSTRQFSWNLKGPVTHFAHFLRHYSGIRNMNHHKPSETIDQLVSTCSQVVGSIQRLTKQSQTSSPPLEGIASESGKIQDIVFSIHGKLRSPYKPPNGYIAAIAERVFRLCAVTLTDIGSKVDGCGPIYSASGNLNRSIERGVDIKTSDITQLNGRFHELEFLNSILDMYVALCPAITLSELHRTGTPTKIEKRPLESTRRYWIELRPKMNASSIVTVLGAHWSSRHTSVRFSFVLVGRLLIWDS